MKWGLGEISDLMGSSNNHSLDADLRLEVNLPGNQIREKLPVVNPIL